MDDRATSRRHIFGEKFATEILVAELQESMFLLHTTTVITGQGFFTSVCLFVCESVRPLFLTISQKPLRLGSSNLTKKCSTVSPEKPFILGVRKSKLMVTRHAWVGVCTLVSADFF